MLSVFVVISLYLLPKNIYANNIDELFENELYKGNIKEEKQLLEINLNTASKIGFEITSYANSTYELFDANLENKIWSFTSEKDSDYEAVINYFSDIYLSKGKYYLYYELCDNRFDDSNFEIKLLSNEISESLLEPKEDNNQTFSSSVFEIEMNNRYYGVIGALENSDVQQVETDVYRIEIKNNGEFYVDMEHDGGISFDVYDSNLNLLYGESTTGGCGSGSIPFQFEIGTYYLVFNNRYNNRYIEKGYSYNFVVKSKNQTNGLEMILPGKVENLIVEQNSYKSVNLTWDTVAGATSYDVYRKIYKSDAKFKKIKTVSENSYSNDGLVTGKEYSYYVVAKNSVGVSPNSNIVAIKTKLTGNLRLELDTLADSKFKLSWNKIEGATRYIIYRKRNKDSLKKVLTLDGEKSEYVTAEMPHGTYQFVVKAARYDSIDRVMTDNSNKQTVRIERVVPSLKLIPGTNQITLTWEKLDGYSHYELYRSTGSHYNIIKTTTKLSYTDKSLKSNRTYYYKIIGYKEYKAGDKISYKVYTPYKKTKAKAK